MNTGFYTSVSGMSAYQKGMDTIAHNIANAQTIGYKPMQNSFSNALYTEIKTNVEGNHLVGHGVKTQGTQLLYGQGFLQATDRQLDFALVGNGFFGVEREGRVEYTRNGAFSVSVENDGNYLVSSSGGYVLGNNGQRILLDTQGESNIPDFSNLKERLGVFTFENPHGLAPTDGGSFYPTNVSGQAQAYVMGQGDGVNLVQGSLESSGVDMAREMSNVITMQKAFQFNAKMVQTADQLEEVINNLR